MRISNIHITDFRGFENVDIKLGSRLTCIAGRNGVGKSQILALLGNCGELPAKYKTLQNRQYRADWGEIVRGDIKYDSLDPKSNILNISFVDLPKNHPLKEKEAEKYTSNLSFRVSWQSTKLTLKETSTKINSLPSVQQRSNKIQRIANQIKKATNETDEAKKSKNKIQFNFPNRFRIIPEKSKQRNSEAKLVWPTYYLGLSRLYPIGEAEKVKIQQNDSLNKDYLDFFSKAYEKIFSFQDKIDSIDSTNVSDSKRKIGIGIENEYYGALGNSSGQDNLGQIISSVASFDHLKKELKNKYIGGLLLIDELDATLHPSAQKRLLEFLNDQSKKLDLQIVFTTHSLNIIKHFIHLQKNRNDESLELCYLWKKAKKICIEENPSYTWINNELSLSYSSYTRKHQIAVFTEDDTANWLLQNILKIYKVDSMNLLYIKISAGWQEIIKLVSSDFDYFSNSITIVDPDVEKATCTRELAKYDSLFTYNPDNQPNNVGIRDILRFPIISDTDKKYFEWVIWNYFSNLPEDDEFYLKDEVTKIPFSKETLMQNQPSIYKNGNEESKIKAWFKDTRSIINMLLPQFIKEYSSVFDKFVEQFINKYNSIIKSSYPQESFVKFTKINNLTESGQR